MSSKRIIYIRSINKKKVIPGYLDINNNQYVLNTLMEAAERCLCQEFSALVTGPVNKAIINKGGIFFRGHTDFLSKYSISKKTVMMLSNNKFRVALATTHIPISSVSKAITKKSLYKTISILNIGLQKYFNISRPKIYVCGLNPHSGECGWIGKEEITIIIPTLNYLRKNINCDIIGPLSADTIFNLKYLKNSDVILAMYHDQGLPVLKCLEFGRSVNITLGLPFIRTSVDHGTALELAGTGTAQSSSMEIAIKTAITIINNFYEKNIL